MELRLANSISTRLTVMNMLVSVVALSLACVGFFAYDQFTFRQGLVRNLSAQAQIIGSNSVSALIFGDPQAATNTLSALKNSPNIVSAGIFTADRRLFAEYARDGRSGPVSIPPIPAGSGEAYWFGHSYLLLAQSIVFRGTPVGTVYLKADLREINDRLKRYAAISAILLLLSMIAALLVSSVFQRSVALPIVKLAEVARRVSQDKNYAVRAEPMRENDELALLIAAFNEMLAQIQQRDISLQQAHDELEQRVAERTRDLLSSNRELEAFSYSVSHDLRAPLDTMNGFSYVLQKNYADQLDQNGKEALLSIRAGARRMSELIDALLTLSRVTTGSMHREEVDLSALAQSIVEELRRSAPDRKLEVVAPAKAKAYGDARLLRIVMENLLRNAWKYTSRRDQSRIEFGQMTKDAQTVYFVKDNGTGFDSRSADRLFQPFQRLHPAAEFPGDGVGLATVKRIVQRHGGEVWAEAAVDQGATFYFTLAPSRTDARASGV